jgi:hypothetical protein
MSPQNAPYFAAIRGLGGQVGFNEVTMLEFIDRALALQEVD